MKTNKDKLWTNHVRNWKASGLSQNAYCKQNNIYQSTLTRWVKKLDTQITPVKIELPKKELSQVPDIIIEAPELRIRFPQNADPLLISAIIRELKTCS